MDLDSFYNGLYTWVTSYQRGEGETACIAYITHNNYFAWETTYFDPSLKKRSGAGPGGGQEEFDEVEMY